MENVLAAHAKEGSGLSSNSPDTCTCGANTYPERGDGHITERRNRAFAAHVSEALAAAGFGNLHDAWVEGHDAGMWNADEPHPTKTNPYRK